MQALFLGIEPLPAISPLSFSSTLHALRSDIACFVLSAISASPHPMTWKSSR